uniref:PHD-type domain-containing protein n=1 Tax=Glossina morsitans morsitans TaxID=37546 RepID=A0A1B0FKT3_GLOMM
MKEMVGGCCVCSDERGWPENPLVYCDCQNCTVAVHQACYGIVTVPTGPWYCRKCESQERSTRVRCELCPSRDACYICQDVGKSNRATVGACMQCNKSNCKQQFHVACAQSLSLLCGEAGNYLDNVKYCGYCQHHYSKLKKGGNVKTMPPYTPISRDSSSDSASSPEKEIDSNINANASASTTPAAISIKMNTSNLHSASSSLSSSKQRKSSNASKQSTASSSSSSAGNTTANSAGNLNSSLHGVTDSNLSSGSGSSSNINLCTSSNASSVNTNSNFRIAGSL